MTTPSERTAALSDTLAGFPPRTDGGVYRALLDLSSNGILIESERGEVLDCNEAACRIFGYDRGELIGLTIADLVPPEYVGELPERITEDTGGLAAEWLGRRRDGTRFPIEVSTRICEVDGETRVVAHLRDITVEKRAAALLSAKTNVMEAIGKGVPLAEVLDRLVCAVEEHIAGVRASILLLREDRLWSIAAPNLPEEYTRVIDGIPIGPTMGSCGTAAYLRETVVVSDIATDHRWEGYREIALEHGLRACWSQPIIGSRGEVLGTFATYYGEVRKPEPAEILLAEEMANLAGIAIARTRATTALRESERRFRALVESIQEVIVILDDEGFTRYISPAFRTITGYEVDDWLGRHAEEIIHPDDLDLVRAHFTELHANPGAAVRGEIRIRHRDDSWRRIELLAQNLLDDQYLRGIVVTYQDITEQRRLEEQLHESQKLEAVGRLAGGVAHDFNNILNIIGGLTHLTFPNLPDDSPIREDLQEIIAAVEQGASLTQQLLAFSRRQVLNPKVLDIHHEIRDLARMLRRVIGEDIRLMTRLDSTGYLRADPGQINQVLVNLAVNARDAMPEGGTLTISTRDVELSDVEASHFPEAIQPGRYIEIAVEDTGTGMDPQTLAHIFEPFFTTKDGRGSGLGLSTVYGIIRQSGGHIYAESTPGAGSTFRILLPRVAPVPTSMRPRSAAPETPDDARGETILLVEDAPAMRMVTRRILEKNGYQVIEAQEAETALQLAERHQDRIDLVITDIIMPGMSGTTLARELVERYPDLPIIFISGYTDGRALREDFQHDHARFLQKPFAPVKLVQMVRGVLEERG